MASVSDTANKRPRDNFRLRILESCLRLRVSVAIEILQKKPKINLTSDLWQWFVSTYRASNYEAEMIGLVNTRISA